MYTQIPERSKPGTTTPKDSMGIHSAETPVIPNITLKTITQAVIEHGDGGKTHPRLHEIYASLVSHLHAFVREVNLTEQELQQERDFLNRASRHTQEIPDGEIHMLTDLLGISELVELLHADHSTATESNLEGPTYVANAPEFSRSISHWS